MTFAAAAIAFHTERRIGRDHADLDGVIENDAQHLEQIVRRLRSARLRADDVLHVNAMQVLERSMTVLGAEAFEDVAADGLRARLEAAKFG